MLVTHFPQIGPHHRILTLEKNENPQNILVVYTKLDGECRFVKTGRSPLVDFYWLMNGKDFKPTHALIKSGVRKRLRVSAVASDPRAFEMRISDLSELGAKMKKPLLLVRSEKFEGQCRVAGYFDESGRNPTEGLRVTSLYSESRKIMLPPFRKLLAVTVKGTGADGRPVERKFEAK